MQMNKTNRGFDIAKFTDLYNNECSLQKSSLATEDAIWLGISNTKLTVFEDESKGKYKIIDMPENLSVNTRMHLSRQQVADLLPFLQNFVETGYLTK